MPHPEPVEEAVDPHAFQKVRDGLLDLHELFLVGEGNSGKAKDIRNATDEPWFDLSDEQQDLLNGLTQDLLDVQEVTSQPEPQSIPLAEQGILEAVVLQHNGRYREALEELLRQNRASKPFSRISFFRGRCWEGLNEPRVALMFFRHAHKLSPTNEEYESAALGALADAYPERARAEAQRILERADAESPIVVIQAAEIAFQSAQNSDDQEMARTIYGTLIEPLRRAFCNLQGGGTVRKRKAMSDYQPIYSVLFSLLAACCRNANNIDAAFHYYTLAIGLDPFNAPLLTARGASIYNQSGFSQQIAAEDFQRAIMVGTDQVVPYFLLAHFLLHRAQFEACLKAVEDGIGKSGTQRMKSEMLEFRAIALAALWEPREAVVEAFRAAERQDPTNERAATNLREYEDALKKREQKPSAQEEPLDLARFAFSIDATHISSYLALPPTLRDAEKRMATAA